MTMKSRFLCTWILALAAAAGGAHAAEWYPLKVSARAPGPEAQDQLADYRPLDKASRNWSICVSLPHLKDPFFVAINYGMIEEAKRQGVRVQTMDAGGYTGLSTQISQIENCVAGGAHAVVMAAIAADGMDNVLKHLKEKGIPVVDAINGVTSRDTGVRVLTSPRDEALRAGQYLARKHPAGSKPVKIAWLPGPAGAGFVEAFNSGFQEGIKGSAVVIAEAKYGDVGKEVQARLVEDLLQTHKDLDYIVGTAVMVEAAVPLLKARRVADKVKPVSVYMSAGVRELLKTGDVEAAGAVPIVLVGRVMLDSAVRLLERKVEFTDVNALGQTYTTANIGALDVNTVIAPAKFRPVFSFDGR